MERAVEPDFRGPRRRLIETLQANGISDLAVLRAFDVVPRHLFVPTGVRHRSYEDSSLPIGSGQIPTQASQNPIVNVHQGGGLTPVQFQSPFS